MTIGTASSSSLTAIAHHDLGGRSDGMQVIRHENTLYVGHYGLSGAGTSILDVSDTEHPELVDQWDAPAFSHTHKVQVADGLLLVNHESFPATKPPRGPHSAGLAIYDVADANAPRKVAFWESGGRGVHRIVWEGGRYAHMSAIPAGFNDRIWIVIDLQDPTAPELAAQWWWPGQRDGEEPDWEPGERFAAHHALVHGRYAYLGYDDANLVILDVEDFTKPKMVSNLQWGGASTHTCLPLGDRGIVAVTDEQTIDGPDAPERFTRLVDVSDPYSPQVVGVAPSPKGPYRSQGLRHGPHCLHENRAGSYRSSTLIFATYFNAGVRVFDVSDPREPVEVAHWVSEAPPGQAAPQSNDIFVDQDYTVWVTDRISGGLFALKPDDRLRDLMRSAQME